jgi:2Fe-2S ferredoxin
MLIRLNVIDREGKKTAIDIEEGTTIRDAIEEKISPDNYGVCGGNCSCGTCHVYVAPDDLGKLKAKAEDEIHILNDAAVEPTPHSRLGCQIELQKEYNNITVTIAPD